MNPRRSALFRVLTVLIIAMAVLSAVHTHANPSEHPSCVLCQFTSTLSLIVLAIWGLLTASVLSSGARYEKPQFLRISPFSIGQPVLRAPPILLTA